MSAASGAVDVSALGDTIAGLAKREFVLRRAGTDQPETFTTRWAMSYLRGPLTRDQIALLVDDAARDAVALRVDGAPAAANPSTATTDLAGDETTVVPDVAAGIQVRWVDVAAPWLADIGADPAGSRREAALVARVALRYDETKADLVHDAEYEAVVFPLGDQLDASRAVPVDHDERDLRTEPPGDAVYRLPTAPVTKATFFSSAGRALGDHLARSLTLELLTNSDLRLYGRPGEDRSAFEARCAAAADEGADAETAKLRDKYEVRATRLRDQIAAAEDRADVLSEEAEGRRNSELLSTAGSVLGGLLGGSRSRGGLLGKVLGGAGTAAGRRGRTSASEKRVDAAENKVQRLADELRDLDAELSAELADIDGRWSGLAANISTTEISLERSDVKVTQLVLAWVPVA
jgi:hypothetical protein